MKKSALTLALALVLLLSWRAGAQTTQITASNIDYFGGAPVTGAFCVTPTNQGGAPINLVTPTGQQLAPNLPLCFPVLSGALQHAVVPDTSRTQPANACLKVTIFNSSNTQVGSYPCIQPSGATWSFDAYVPSSLPLIPQLQLPQFETNGVANPVQSSLNLVAGPGASLSPAGGSVTISAAGAVTSVSNSDGTLTISPTTGGVIGSLDLAHANAWTAPQTFSAIDVNGAPTGNPATIFVQKNPSDYGLYIYDDSGSATPQAEAVDAEIYGVTGSLTSLRANYRGHIDPSNSTPTQFQLVNFAAGSHGANAVSFASVSDGLDSVGYFSNASGLYNEFTNIGNAPYTVSNVQSVGGVCSITMTGTAAFLPGSSVIVSGILGATACNGTQTVASVSGSTFTTSTAYSGSPAYASGGAVLQNVSTQNDVVNDFGTGDTFDVNQSAAAKTGDIFHVNVNQGGGTLLGNFISYFIDGAPAFFVTNIGEIETAASVSTPSITINGDSPFTANPRAFLPFSTGQLAGIVAGGQYFAGQLAKAATVESFVGTAAAFACTVNPVLTLEDCGATGGACASPTALASVTLTAANTVTVGTVASAALAANHYFVVETTAGACTSLNATGGAEFRMD